MSILVRRLNELREKNAILYRNPHHLLVRHIKPFLERHTRMRANVDTKKGAQCVVFKYDKYFFTTDTQTVEKRSWTGLH